MTCFSFITCNLKTIHFISVGRTVAIFWVLFYESVPTMIFISPVVFVRCWWSCCLAAQQHPSSLVTHFILWVLHNVRLFCGKQKGANHQDFTLIVVNGAAGHRELIKFKYYTLFARRSLSLWKMIVEGIAFSKAAQVYFYLVSMQPSHCSKLCKVSQ